MADNHTIRGTVGLDTKPAKQSLDELEQHVKHRGTGFAKLFAMEPLGERRGARALSRLAEGMTEIGTSGQGAFQAVKMLGLSLSTGIAGGAVIGAVTVMAEKFSAINEEAIKLNSTIANLGARGAQGGAFEGLDHMRETLHLSTDEADKLRLKMITFTKGGALGDFAREFEALFQGKSGKEMGKDMQEQIAALNKTAGDQIGKIAEKNLEVAKVEETRLKTGQKEAALMAEDIKDRETMGQLAEEETLTHTKNTAALDEENRRHKEATSEIDIKEKAVQREVQARMHEAEIQLRISKLGQSGLTHDQQSLAVARDKVDAAKEELSAAEAAVAAARSREEVDAARERLTKAQAGVASAAGGAGEVAGSQLEKEGAEEAMSGQEKSAQYQQRIKQMEGIRHAAARRGINTDLISGPRYGEAGYDPTARYRAAVAQQSAYQEQPWQPQPYQPQPDLTYSGQQPIATEGGKRGLRGQTRDESLRHQMSRVRWPWSDRDDRDRPMRGDEQIMPNIGQPGAMPSALPSPSGTPQASMGDLPDKVASAVKAAMAEAWGRA